MSKFEVSDNSGFLFDNSEDKRPGKKDADFRGKAKIDGALYWVSAWKRTASNGKDYFSLSIAPHRAKGDAPQKAPAKAAPAPAPDPEFNDDIPF